MSTLFNSLERGEGQNAASIPKIQILPCAHIQTWPGSRLGKMSGAILVRPNLQWATIYNTDQSRAYSEKAIETVHGRKFAFQFSGFHPGDSEDLRRFLGVTDWVPFIARVVDAHGLVRIVGTDKFGIEMNYESMIAAEMGGKRGTMITFSGELPVPSALEY